ncbi:MAG: DUF1499 domain-containing protein [Pseudomonadota bacterium]
MTRRLLFGAGLLTLAGLGYIRTAPMDPEVWHADPEAGARTGKPNDYLVGPGGDREAIVVEEAPAELLARLDAVALAEPGTTRLAGDPAEGWVTYVQRSRLMGYPDAISVRVVPEGAGGKLMIWSRSRYGHSDLGVNRARVMRWLDALALSGLG